ncbi:MAG: 1-acyl-sn-glycerol-3-phosphate acyltransferase [Rickettsiales bacterium]|jgi:1-acyl-sn-glycerol-3-phosphate acyltransferase|nr:1-acyl-sn-glycerol-3-phosphate acyltransferase [Rickettsiales bacterium]
MFKTYIFKLTLALWFVLWVPFLILVLPSKWLTRKFMTLDAIGVLRIARIVVGIKYKVHDAGHQDGPHIIAAKHMSILEVAAILEHIPNAFFILKKELMYIPVYGWAFWRMGLQPVNRAKGATDLKTLTRAVEKKIAGGMTLVIFPEGTRAKPGQRPEIKKGVMFIASILKLNIVPVGTDSGLYWPKKGKMNSGTANIWFEPELPYNAPLAEISEAINKHSA